jgi:predicted TPR repeat methyltransferase
VLFLLCGTLAKRYKRLDAQGHLQQGNNYFIEGNYDEAIESFKKSVRQEPTFAAAWANLGNSYRIIGDYDLSIESLRNAAQLEPDVAKHHYNLGVTHQTKGDSDAATSAYRQAIDLDPTHVNAHYNYGILLQEVGALSEALAMYSDVMKLSPTHVDARLNTCNILLAMQRYDITEKCFLDVLSIDQEHVRAMINLAGFYDATSSMDSKDTKAEEKSQKALELYEKALTLDPNNVFAKHGLRALSGEDVTNEMSKEYVKELFDSYSYHFEHSLMSLKYVTHTLVAEMVSKYSTDLLGHRIEEWVSRFDATLTKDDKDAPYGGVTLPPIALNILDLGAGTGLVCEPTKDLLSVAFQDRIRAAKSKHGSKDSSAFWTFSESNAPVLKLLEGLELKVNMTAVDLSEKMLRKSEERRCYSSIVVDDVNEYVKKYFEKHRMPVKKSPSLQAKKEQLMHAETLHRSQQYAFVVAADVFVYIGDLQPVLASIRQVVDPLGAVVFSVEAGRFAYEETSTSGNQEKNIEIAMSEVGETGANSAGEIGMYYLQSSGRFAHSESYIRWLAGAIGFKVLVCDQKVLRMDRGNEVVGFVVALQPI